MTTILVVDDEYLIADILGFALEDEGFMVVTASNGRKALDVLERERPSLIITDFMMPVMDGQQLAEAVRALPSVNHLPIILMSGAQAHIGMERSDLFDAVLAKPFKIDLIVAEVRRLLAAT
ncbi:MULTISPECIES: response regulator [Pseudomonas]|jgi:two-component system, OmpR family, response regulator VicR|uniref:Response regulator n=1 Tax=Pseudomonas rhodesiae TaxID=76760 RepID=A0A5C5NJZ5_9PSED|nr:MULTISPECIES: response regulator [Pseudomonas]KAF6687573.1 response regulator [Pseudomonas sp. EKM23D]MBB4815897.1 CheY-like chemotaxis protein [Pseudomonas rhodesiae]MBI6605342.1 response regulator [Pseudomonas sp. S4_EA_1b]MBI6626848.1 response regulator [Pseudomonas rhodesiae]MBX4139313.1 response regulator [Pseudomonas sp. S5F11]